MAYSRAAIVLPGRTFGPHAPLLWYCAWAALNRGANVHYVQWNEELLSDSITADQRVTWVNDQLTLALKETGPALLIGKSLGTLGAGLAAELELPAVWLTPLLLEARVVDALRAATAPYILVGGTDDPYAWDGTVARSLTPDVYEVDGADHLMLVPGPLAESADVLGRVVGAVERFLDTKVWP